MSYMSCESGVWVLQTAGDLVLLDNRFDLMYQVDDSLKKVGSKVNEVFLKM